MYKTIGILLVISTIVGGVWWKISNLNEEIERQKSYVSEKVDKIEQLTLQLGLEKSNIGRLESTIDEMNKATVRLSKEYKQSMRELEEWKNKEPEVKYKTKVVKEIVELDNNNTCEYGLELNNKISNLEYEDL